MLLPPWLASYTKVCCQRVAVAGCLRRRLLFLQQRCCVRSRCRHCNLCAATFAGAKCLQPPRLGRRAVCCKLQRRLRQQTFGSRKKSSARAAKAKMTANNKGRPRLQRASRQGARRGRRWLFGWLLPLLLSKQQSWQETSDTPRWQQTTRRQSRWLPLANIGGLLPPWLSLAGCCQLLLPPRKPPCLANRSPFAIAFHVHGFSLPS